MDKRSKKQTENVPETGSGPEAGISGDSVTLKGNIGSHSFVRFALYDEFILKKRWRRPVLFAAILLCFAAVCFFMRGRHEQASLLALVLTSVGLVVPTVYVLMFIVSSREQADRLVLSPIIVQYTGVFSKDGVAISNEKERSSLTWKQVWGAVRKKDCMYLYASPQKAFLFPECEDSDRAWELICSRIPGRILPRTGRK